MGDASVVDGGTLLTRCAWCEHYSSLGVWVPEAELDAQSGRRKSPQVVTHGICPPCFDGLRASGLSR